jgi:hypothetical protein
MFLINLEHANRKLRAEFLVYIKIPSDYSVFPSKQNLKLFLLLMVIKSSATSYVVQNRIVAAGCQKIIIFINGYC